MSNLKLSKAQKEMLAKIKEKEGVDFIYKISEENNWYSWRFGFGHISTNTLKSLINNGTVALNNNVIELTALGKTIEL